MVDTDHTLGELRLRLRISLSLPACVLRRLSELSRVTEAGHYVYLNDGKVSKVGRLVGQMLDLRSSFSKTMVIVPTAKRAPRDNNYSAGAYRVRITCLYEAWAVQRPKRCYGASPHW
jgi:hypothetical protein